ncbi:RrF2 family transcriptional regulator [Marinicella sp. W31]|uniref:RrF2 family transcriptional regulator n=1 Tax=Marinicella sp. W31 TaxID=3023713 RepID=UPI0037565C72
MIKMSRLTEYACMVLVALDKAPEAMSADMLSQHAGLEKPTVSKILKLLRKADLLSSKRGSTGGYSLCKPIEQINLHQVISAVEGHWGLTDCIHGDSACERSRHCAISNGLKKVNLLIANALQGVSIAELRGHQHNIQLIVKS